MSSKRSSTYERPSVTEYGSVEAVTETKNKYWQGNDVDVKAINLKGSVGYK